MERKGPVVCGQGTSKKIIILCTRVITGCCRKCKRYVRFFHILPKPPNVLAQLYVLCTAAIPHDQQSNVMAQTSSAGVFTGQKTSGEGLAFSSSMILTVTSGNTTISLQVRKQRLNSIKRIRWKLKNFFFFKEAGPLEGGKTWEGFYCEGREKVS